MDKTYIFVDNMRLGGFQRVALDQAYALSDYGYFVTLVVCDYESTLTSLGFLSLEQDMIKEKHIQINFVSNRWQVMIRDLSAIVTTLDTGDILISHSMRSAFILRLLNSFFRRTNSVFLTIHQIPRLTDIKQRVKRFIYAQFADRLLCFSYSVELDWYSQFRYVPSWILKKFTKGIKTSRNGIYLSRLPHQVRNRADSEKPRIIFLGRLAFWKGLERIEALMENIDLSDYEFVFLVPEYDAQVFEKFELVLGSRLVVISGSSITSFDARLGDVHIYPTNYGEDVPLFESISLNCLEFAAIGVPSVVTRGGMRTWKMDCFESFFYETDWNNPSETVQLILKINSESESILRSDKKIDDVRMEISMLNRVKPYFSYSSSDSYRL